MIFQDKPEKKPLCGKQIFTFLSHDTSWGEKIGWQTGFPAQGHHTPAILSGQRTSRNY